MGSEAKMPDQRPRLMIHGYGLLDEERRVVAGSRMSGLALYNTFLVEGLAPSYQLTFLCGCLKKADLVASAYLCASRIGVPPRGD